MWYSVLADVVMVVHFAFILFVAIGAILAWRWPMLIWVHVPAVAWGVGIVTVGSECPLTPLERYLRERAGEQSYSGGFVDRYIEGVVYPERFTPLLRGAVAAVVLVGWLGVALRHRRTCNAGSQRSLG